MQGYDCDAAGLVLIYEDGIAVVALDHNGERILAQMRFEERLALGKVGDVRPCEDKARGIAQCVAGQVDFSR